MYHSSLNSLCLKNCKKNNRKQEMREKKVELFQETLRIIILKTLISQTSGKIYIS